MLFVNTEIRNKIKEKQYKANINDLIYIPKIEMLKLTKDIKEKFQKGFSKEYREMEEEKLLQEIVSYMKEFDMLREKEETEEYIIMPMCFKIIGKYPEEFNV